MLDIKDFSVFEDQASFGVVNKIGSYWNGFVSLIITFTIAYQVNIRKGKSSMETLISVRKKAILCLRLIRVLF
jgi:hypothetical protein